MVLSLTILIASIPNSDTKDASLVFVLLFGCAFKIVAITSTCLGNGYISIEHTVILRPEVSIAATTSQILRHCRIYGFSYGYDLRKCPIWSWAQAIKISPLADKPEIFNSKPVLSQSFFYNVFYSGKYYNIPLQ